MQLQIYLISLSEIVMSRVIYNNGGLYKEE